MRHRNNILSQFLCVTSLRFRCYSKLRLNFPPTDGTKRRKIDRADTVKLGIEKFDRANYAGETNLSNIPKVSGNPGGRCDSKPEPPMLLSRYDSRDNDDDDLSQLRMRLLSSR